MSARSQEQVGSRDETYVKVASKWAYLYRTVDQHGQVIDVLLCTRRVCQPRDIVAEDPAGQVGEHHATVLVAPVVR
jgi:hypothetical protein